MKNSQDKKSVKLSTSNIAKGNRNPEPHEKKYMKN